MIRGERYRLQRRAGPRELHTQSYVSSGTSTFARRAVRAVPSRHVPRQACSPAEPEAAHTCTCTVVQLHISCTRSIATCAPAHGMPSECSPRRRGASIPYESCVAEPTAREPPCHTYRDGRSPLANGLMIELARARASQLCPHHVHLVRPSERRPLVAPPHK